MGRTTRRDQTASQVQIFSGAGAFLPTPPGMLRRTGHCHQFQYSSEYGVDVLIFAATGLIEHVPLSNIDSGTLAKLTGNVVLNWSVDGRTDWWYKFLTTLQEIWCKIVVPIFDKVQVALDGNSNLPQHWVWWYPTGPLTFIPIHAVGPGNGAPDVSRLIISSYVTTLHSLLQAQRQKMPVMPGCLKFLAISQPESPDQAPLPYSTEEVEILVQVACSAGWSEEDILHLPREKATVDHVLDALDSCSCVHFACHGSQDPIVGMESAFALHDGDLELGKIASKKLSTAQFAFLSTCHAASGLKHLPGEAMHLAAGLQFAGFCSVIATMWSILDEVAPKVAEHTY